MKKPTMASFGRLNKCSVQEIARGFSSAPNDTPMFNQMYSEPKIYFYEGLSAKYPEERIRQTITQIITMGQEDAFHVTDLSAAEVQISRWKRFLPWIDPHYAIKSNSSDILLDYFHQRGLSFDVASLKEIQQCQKLGVDPKNIIYSNPCKFERDLMYADSMGIKLTVFDSLSELYKIHAVYPKAHLLLRIKATDNDAQVQFSHRFGCGSDEWQTMLREAKRLGFDVRGISFHVGSGVAGGRSEVFRQALYDAREVFNMGGEMGFKNMDTVNIGGGFGAEENLEDLSRTLKEARDDFPGCRWIAEPGRFMSASTQIAAARVMLTKKGQITLNDGVYGTFSCIPYDHAPIPDSVPITADGSVISRLNNCYVFGPSCDGYDIVSSSLPVPHDIKVGDWLVFGAMGAYTQASCSEFNGIARSHEYCPFTTYAQQEVMESEASSAMSQGYPA